MELLHLCLQRTWDYKLVQPRWKMAWICLKKLRRELPCDPAISLLGIYPKNMKTKIQKDIYTCVHCSIISSSQDMETMSVSTDGWVDKGDMVYVNVYSQWNSSHINSELLPFLTAWMDLEDIVVSEINHTEKDTDYMISRLCGIQKQSKLTNK